MHSFPNFPFVLIFSGRSVNNDCHPYLGLDETFPTTLLQQTNGIWRNWTVGKISLSSSLVVFRGDPSTMATYDTPVHDIRPFGPLVYAFVDRRWKSLYFPANYLYISNPLINARQNQRSDIVTWLQCFSNIPDEFPKYFDLIKPNLSSTQSSYYKPSNDVSSNCQN